ncbi:3-dehydroquinate synthase-domain-containing protein [Gilbertella persicaria]|uniref:3-dehydroquinate synthase-domain-containing protein n=1 Tax=Gilbertella persicaria TaxID=101096 RepID=UPI00221FD945|nr:3-dehydroquinate synthase-domain-containing protein [Gilbertella persicaria]KAI8087628.1 3-dehydroquinate synthase-domain-containing protein [Gilbertella persicaria]
MDHIANDITKVISNVSNYIVITDNHLAPLYLQKLLNTLQSRLSPHQRLLSRVLPFGEQSKSRQAKADIEDFLLDASCTRDSCFIALGGGVIGDLVGYVASTFMRGVPFVQIPTTLLAMVDSSVGGKTAIDTPHGKNLIGTFWQPKRIYLDLAVLGTLPKRELANGMAEVIKTAAISSESEFVKLETGKNKIEKAIASLDNPNDFSQEKEFLASVVCASARFKANVVTQDEREGGLRGLLNFGHSIGHAYEAILAPIWLHGECVSLGLIHEAELSTSLGHCSYTVVERLKNCLSLYGLPTSFDNECKKKLCFSDVMNAMKVDKKNKGSQKRIVLLADIGKTVEQKASDVPDTAIEAILAKYVSFKQTTADGCQVGEDKLHASFQFVATFEHLKPFIAELSKVLIERFNVKITTSNETGHTMCVTRMPTASQYSIHFTDKAGTSSGDSDSYWFEYVVRSTQQTLYEDTINYLQKIAGQYQNHIYATSKTQSTFVTLPISDYSSILPSILHQWTEHTDAIEFRVDHLVPLDNNWIKTTGMQLMMLRQTTQLPIIYTVRTQPQAGKFDPSLLDLYLELIQWGHRWGCEYVDVELTTPSLSQLEAVMKMNQNYPGTRLIASFHDPDHQYPWSGPYMKSMYGMALSLFERYKHQGVIKLVGFAQTFYDNIELEVFRHHIDPDQDKRIILINMGPNGKFSRVANYFLSPATHPALPTVAAPGQLSVAELSLVRKQLAMNLF